MQIENYKLMSKFTYYIPKLEYPKKGLLKTVSLEFQKWSNLKKATFISLTLLIFTNWLSPWFAIGEESFYSTDGIVSFIGILIYFFNFSILYFFITELAEIKTKIAKENIYKWMLFASFEVFILCVIGFSISHNINYSLTQDARPLVGVFISLLFSLALFIEIVALNVYEKPNQIPKSAYLIPEEKIEESLDEYLEKRIEQMRDENEKREPSKEQSMLFDI